MLEVKEGAGPDRMEGFLDPFDDDSSERVLELGKIAGRM